MMMLDACTSQDGRPMLDRPAPSPTRFARHALRAGSAHDLRQTRGGSLTCRACSIVGGTAPESPGGAPKAGAAGAQPAGTRRKAVAKSRKPSAKSRKPAAKSHKPLSKSSKRSELVRTGQVI